MRRSASTLAHMKRVRFWIRLALLYEWDATGSLWSEAWEAREYEALREAFGVIDRLERAPRVADDADLVWQPSRNPSGFRPYHVAMWHPELRTAGYGR